MVHLASAWRGGSKLDSMPVQVHGEELVFALNSERVLREG